MGVPFKERLEFLVRDGETSSVPQGASTLASVLSIKKEYLKNLQMT
jgi:hypothetical protein